MDKPLRASKQVLHEEVQKLKKVGGYWKWPENPEDLGNGNFRTSCTFGREENDPNPITVYGEGKGKKAAEHSAASQILHIIESTTFGNPNDSAGTPEREFETSNQPNLSSRKTTSTQNTAANNAAAVAILKVLLVYLPQSIKQNVQLHSALRGTIPPNLENVKILLAQLTRDVESVFSVDVKCSSEEYSEQPSSIVRKSTMPSACGKCDEDSGAVKNPPLEKPLTSNWKSMLDEPPSGKPTKVSEKVWYYPESQLGVGKISEVYRGYLEKPFRTKAIKKVSLENHNLIERHKREEKSLQKLRKLNHEYFVQYYVTEEMDDHVFYVFDEADCTLEYFVKQSERTHADEILSKICTDITNGLKNLHRRQIHHGDVSPQNVFLLRGEKNSSDMPTAKITAFGLSRVVNQIKNHSQETFTQKRSRDIFQLGLTFGFTMTGGKSLVESTGNEETSIDEMEINWNLLDEPKFAALRNLLQKMLAKDPADRPETSILLEHPFFWNNERRLGFILAVTADIKQNKAPSNHIQTEYIDYTSRFGISDNWQSRLDALIQDWILKEHQQKLEQQLTKQDKKKKPWQYKTQSAVHLIKFIRDQHQHYGNWKSLVKDSLRNRLEDENLWGHKGCNFGRYFATRFPELTTILYNVMQDREFQGNHTEIFYGYNDCMCFNLIWDERNYDLAASAHKELPSSEAN